MRNPPLNTLTAILSRLLFYVQRGLWRFPVQCQLKRHRRTLSWRRQREQRLHCLPPRVIYSFCFRYLYSHSFNGWNHIDILARTVKQQLTMRFLHLSNTRTWSLKKHSSKWAYFHKIEGLLGNRLKRNRPNKSSTGWFLVLQFPWFRLFEIFVELFLTDK